MGHPILVFEVSPGLRFSPQFLPPAAENQPYSATLTARRGQAPYKFTLVSGEAALLAAGLTFVDNGDGTATVAGTPTESATISLRIRLRDVRRQPRERTFVLQIADIPQPAVPVVVSGTAPAGEVGVPYTYTFTATGGDGGPYTWSLASGSLPPGITRSGATISGTPTTQGDYSFVIRATDGDGSPGDSAPQSVEIEAAGDPYWANVSSLLYGDSITADETGKTWTVPAGEISVDSTRQQFGMDSLRFGAAPPDMRLPDDDSCDFGAGDFTIEFRVYLDTTGATRSVLSKRANNASYGGVLFLINGSSLQFLAYLGGGWDVNISTGAVISATTWHAIGLRRSGNVWSVWVDNVQIASATQSGSIPGNSDPFRWNESGTNLSNLAQMRITKGVARDLSIPQTAPWPNS